MSVKSSKLLLFLVINSLFLAAADAQTSSPQAVKNRPFGVGEVLAYEGKFTKIIRGIAIADLNFTVASAQNKKDYLIKAEAKSKGTLLKLFRFSFLQQIESTIENEAFRSLKTVKHDVQKERVRDSEAVFNYENRRVTYVETDPKEPARPPRRIASSIERETFDLISGIYRLRLLPLAVGESFELSISDSGLVYKIPVRVTAREEQKTILGKVWCFRLEPEVFGDNRLIEREGNLTIWLTDDERRIPVRAQINSDIGKVEVKLKRVSGRR